MSKNPTPKRTVVGIGSAVAIALLSGMGWLSTQSDDSHDSGSQNRSTPSGINKCNVASLPKEAEKQIKDILHDAPPDDGPADGKHFGNYENILPKQKSSYYREYTVKTTGLNHRGERRLVVGGGSKTNPEVWYYSGDHFESFCQIPDAKKSG
ncbi:ribonuclease domain-containing protein [Corynebacterium resistens]